jgi:hypothetical protein
LEAFVGMVLGLVVAQVVVGLWLGR